MTAQVISIKEKVETQSTEPKCSFCNRSKREVKSLVASPDHKRHICDQCIKHSVALIQKHS